MTFKFAIRILIKGIICVFILLNSVDAYTQPITAVKPTLGSGSLGDPYQISDLSNLRWLSETSAKWSDYFIQMDHIDAAESINWNNGAGFLPIGSETINFTGEYNGGGFKIENLYINRPTESRIGLFGQISDAILSDIHIIGANVTGNGNVGALFAMSYQGTTTKIRNVSVTNSKITGKADNVGGISGYVESTNISNSYGSGNEVYAEVESVGGLVGYVTLNSVIEDCFSMTKVTGETNVGGIAGFMDRNSKVTNSFSTGIVSANTVEVGGLIGKKTKNSDVVDSYYNNETSGQSDVGKGDGLSTAKLMTTSTYGAGWNINGSGDATQPWVQVDGISYPYIFNQTVSITNGKPINDSIESYVVVIGGAITQRGFRYTKASGASNWIEVPSAVPLMEKISKVCLNR